MKKPAILGVVLFGVAACQDATSPHSTATLPTGVNAAAARADGDYIVTLRADETDSEGQARALVAAHGGSLRHVYRTALKGFAVAGLPDAAVEALSRNPRVVAIERDAIVSVTGSGSQSGATWGLDRIDQRDRPVNGIYEWDADGAGVTAYILDTGIMTSHSQFTGRTAAGFTAIADGNGTNDCHGHGTHVAGTVGGTTHGVAKQVTLVPVRVLGCGGSGSTSGVIAGIDWVAAHHTSGDAVANMSLGGSVSSALDAAVANAVADGISFSVAAGNENSDACTRSPAREPSAITVGSTTSSDAKSSFSNWGSCVDINAPGSSITSAYITGGTATMSGTSMASPHVAGAAAIYLSANPGSSPAAVTNAIKGSASTGKLTGLVGATPNLLLYTHFGASNPDPDPDPDPDPPASVSIVKTCTNFSCTFNATDGFTSYNWTFGDGASGNGDTVTHGYPEKGGSYTVVVTVPNGSATTTVSCNPKRGCK